MGKKKISIAIDQQPPQQPARLIFLLDRSTSMMRMREEAVSGYNQYLKGQQEAEGEAKISLIFFDSQLKVVYDQVDVKSAAPIKLSDQLNCVDPLVYEPQGMTSLFDFIHQAIMMYKETHQSNQKTILTILTDGDDTSSRVHTYSSVHRLITEIQNELKWEVMFLGANMNAKDFANRVGIKMGNTSQFDYTSKGIGDAMRSMNLATSYTRGDSAAAAFVGASACASADGSVNMSALYDTVASTTPDDISDRLKKFKADKKSKDIGGGSGD